VNHTFAIPSLLFIEHLGEEYIPLLLHVKQFLQENLFVLCVDRGGEEGLLLADQGKEQLLTFENGNAPALVPRGLEGYYG